MVVTASTGYEPLAVSPDNIIASVPSKMALATSLASARVGRGFWIIDSNICVAVITGLPRRLHFSIIIFCNTGTSSAGISTPKSPRAIIRPSATSRISSILLTPSAFSILAIILISFCSDSKIRRIATTSLARCIKDAATKSTPCWQPKRKSNSSCSDTGGKLSATPGTATRLRLPISPLFWTVVMMLLPSIASMVNLTRPSAKRTVSPTCTSPTKPLWFTVLMSCVPSTSSVVNVNCCPASRNTLPSLNRPRRTSGPFVSSNNAIGLLTIIAASRTICMRSACSSCEPWEKLKRATFMPARIISSKIPNLSVPGPTVHTIFVRFIYPPKWDGI